MGYSPIPSGDAGHQGQNWPIFFAVVGLARREPEKRQNPKVISTVNFWFQPPTRV